MVDHSNTDDRQFPRHIAIIMDGNGRWAKARGLPRAAGHKAGITTLRSIVEYCAKSPVQVLTVYAFSSENWRRPEEEVGLLMDLFLVALNEQINDLHSNNVNVQFIGDLERFPAKLQKSIQASKALTGGNNGLKLRIAANYGGQWDITNACRGVARAIQSGELRPEDVTEERFASFLSMSELPDPDLFIRTGGEQRISNYLLWQLAYTEMFFTDTHWPDFSTDKLAEACEWYADRQRRFGRTSEQLKR